MTFIILIFAVVTALLCLLSLARLSGKFLWTLWVSFLSLYVAASKLSLMILTDSESEFDLRVLGVSSILGGCLAILIPIFHRMSDAGRGAVGAWARDTIHCPLCGENVPLDQAPQRCAHCGRTFLVRMDCGVGPKAGADTRPVG